MNLPILVIPFVPHPSSGDDGQWISDRDSFLYQIQFQALLRQSKSLPRARKIYAFTLSDLLNREVIQVLQFQYSLIFRGQAR
jgi:hypothetical protein